MFDFTSADRLTIYFAVVKFIKADHLLGDLERKL